MLRLIITILFFSLSLLSVCNAPSYFMWYVAILVTEFPLLFLFITALLLFWGFRVAHYRAAGTIIGLIAFVLFLLPVADAYIIGKNLPAKFDSAFGVSAPVKDHNPFSFWRMLAGKGANDVPYTTIPYTAPDDKPLTLDYYHARAAGKRPCVIVVHGGSWSAGDSRQLPELNSAMARAGYNVATINYRLAPAYHSPAPVADVQAALAYLRAHAQDLSIDTNSFILLGRSAGGQIVLSAAYTLHDAGIKGVVNFYGPTDMVWGYANPANPMVIDTKKIMEDYLGGTYGQVPQNYTASSATAAISRGAPPTLTIHGKNDPLVAYEHCTRLEQRLQSAGVRHLSLSLPWATHGCDYSLNGPSGQLSTYTVLRFLDAVTK